MITKLAHCDVSDSRIMQLSGVTDPLAATLVGGDGGNGLEPIVSTIGQMTLLLRHH